MVNGYRDYTEWTWFDYRLHFDRSTDPDGAEAFDTALRFEALGTAFNAARFAGFPPARRLRDGSRNENRVGSYVMSESLHFGSDFINKSAIADRMEALRSDGMDTATALAWAELHNDIGIERLRKLIGYGDIDPVELREMLWDEMWDFEFTVSVHRNSIDIEMAREVAASDNREASVGGFDTEWHRKMEDMLFTGYTM